MFIALTGGIGCGKSAALKFLGECGFTTADADKLCHAYYDNAEGIAQIAGRWPSVIDANGKVDRKKLGNIVFRDENDLAWLESVIAPFLQAQLDDLQQKNTPTVVEVPLLFEKNMAARFDKTVAVWSPFALRRSRLMMRNWDHAECSRRERLQWTPEKKLAMADYGLINTGSLELLQMQCRQLAEKLLK